MNTTTSPTAGNDKPKPAITDLSFKIKTSKATIRDLSGSCICGASRYKVNGPPSRSVICHCHNCQKWSGGPFAAQIYIPRVFFNLDEAYSAHIRSYTDTQHDGVEAIERHFCGKCGSNLYVDVQYLDIIMITRGTVDSPLENFRVLDPEVEYCCSQRVSWAEISSTRDKRQGLYGEQESSS